MDRAAILERLRASETELRGKGVDSLSLFGSAARGENGPNSDIDIAVTLNKRARIDLLDFAALNLQLQDLLGIKVDLVSRSAVKAAMRAAIDRDGVDAF